MEGDSPDRRKQVDRVRGHGTGAHGRPSAHAEDGRLAVRSTIILDRDGVLNRDRPDFVRSPADWVPIPGSLEAAARLSRSGFRVVVVTNQSGLARGLARGLPAYVPRTLSACFGGALLLGRMKGVEEVGCRMCPRGVLAG